MYMYAGSSPLHMHVYTYNYPYMYICIYPPDGGSPVISWGWAEGVAVGKVQRSPIMLLHDMGTKHYLSGQQHQTLGEEVVRLSVAEQMANLCQLIQILV